MAPELLLPNANATPASDMYALGVTIEQVTILIPLSLQRSEAGVYSREGLSSADTNPIASAGDSGGIGNA